jgi:hypothetical protein
MDESEARVEMAGCFESEADRLVASRILERPDAYRRWEAEHAQLLRAVSEQAQLSRQVFMLRAAACALVHRKALLKYLRECQVPGARRHRLFAIFYGFRDYTSVSRYSWRCFSGAPCRAGSCISAGTLNA